MAEGTYNLLWIPLFPLMGAIFNLLLGGYVVRTFGDRLGKEIVHLVAIGAVAFSCFFTFSLVSGAMVGQGEERLVQRIYPWMISGETFVGFDLLLDHLSAVMCMVITGVGLLIHIFSVGYMAKDPGYHRYFAYLNLFMASMLILVLGKSLALLFVGWEGVGLCSYLLIGFWFTDDAKATAGRKAFIFNRIGDFGFILGMLLVYAVCSSLDFDAIAAACAGAEDSMFVTGTIFGASIATVTTGLLFLGCTGKSAQIPLFVWLPDAMAGPTPVSALIHAATMVTAGVYLVVRLNFLFALAPITMAIIAVIGALTAAVAATIAITQNDIKKVLAYSTVSQLGFMFMAVGVGAWVAAIFHLVTHAFFKACLFLGSGAVIEGCHHNQDIRTMGGLRKRMPITAGTFLISCLAIAGVPLFAGFFSKDEILLHVYVNVTSGVFVPGDAVLNYVLYIVGLAAAFCTAFYMFRLYYLTFEGKFRGDHHTWTHYVREYWIMSLPLGVLAVLATFGGFLGYAHALPGHEQLPHLLEEWLEPVISQAAGYRGDFYVGMRGDGFDFQTGVPNPTGFWSPEGRVTAGTELLFMAISVAVAVSGILFARSLYRNGPSHEADAWAKRLGGLYRASKAKYWVDEFYAAVIVRPIRFIAGVCYQAVDQLLIDGLGVSGVSGSVGLMGNVVRVWHNGNVRRYLVVLLLASVYANPTVSQIGPSNVHPVDVGGLRPTLGPQKINKVTILGISFDWPPWDEDAATQTAPEGPSRPPTVGERVEPPRRPAAPSPGDGGAR
jgi:NADH-quinone oxidoreductase subunit L